MMNIKIGTALILEPTNPIGAETYRCKVVEQQDEILYIDYPASTQTNKTVYLLNGSQFRASFQDERNITHIFQTEVLGRKKEKIPMIMISVPQEEDVIRIQRREYVRVKTPVEVVVEFEGRLSRFVTEDISAGGLAFVSPYPPGFLTGDLVNVTIGLSYNNGEHIDVHTDAIVIRTTEVEHQLKISLQFTNVSEADKQQIVRFCFEREVMNRKKSFNA